MEFFLKLYLTAINYYKLVAKQQSTPLVACVPNTADLHGDPLIDAKYSSAEGHSAKQMLFHGYLTD